MPDFVAVIGHNGGGEEEGGSGEEGGELHCGGWWVGLGVDLVVSWVCEEE